MKSKHLLTAVWTVLILGIIGVIITVQYSGLESSDGHDHSECNHDHTGGHEETKKADTGHTEEHEHGEVAAYVNGEAVLLKDLDKGLPDGTFGPRLKKGREMRLSQVSRNIIIRQFLDSEKIVVEDGLLEERFELLKKNPSLIDTGCCSPSSIQEYFELHFSTMADLKLEIKNQVRFEQYLDKMWKLYADLKGGEEKLVKAERERIHSQYAKAHQIFLSKARMSMKNTDPDRAFELLKDKADSITRELESGIAFELLAGKYSEDVTSNKLGGFLGYIEKGYLDEQFSQAAFALVPSAVSKPVKTEYGYHIIKRDKMNNKDVLTVLKDEFMIKEEAKVVKHLMDKAEIRIVLKTERDEEGIDFHPETGHEGHSH